MLPNSNTSIVSIVTVQAPLTVQYKLPLTDFSPVNVESKLPVNEGEPLKLAQVNDIKKMFNVNLKKNIKNPDWFEIIKLLAGCLNNQSNERIEEFFKLIERWGRKNENQYSFALWIMGSIILDDIIDNKDIVLKTINKIKKESLKEKDKNMKEQLLKILIDYENRPFKNN